MSWLALERRAAGELTGDARRAPRRARRDAPALQRAHRRHRRRPPADAASPAPRCWWRPWAAALLAAAVVLVAVRWAAAPSPPAARATRGRPHPAPRAGRPGGRGRHHLPPAHRFRVLLTCPALDITSIVVVQGGVVARPLAEPACGSRRPVPGAFRVDGAEPATVCVPRPPTARSWPASS
ncbi:MAG: hypothetical protein R3F59_07940 [Myxococcota bacterium]